MPTSSSPSLRDLAEDAFAWIGGPKVEFDRRSEFILRNAPNPHPMFGMVLRQRVKDLDGALEATREWFAARGRTQYVWMVADSSEPTDLVEQLLARGLTPDSSDPVYAGMVLERAPDGVDGIEVRRVASFEDFVASATLAWTSFRLTEAEIAEATRGQRERYELFKDFDGGDNFIALVDGEIVGSAGAAYVGPAICLLGGNVAEHARGRGVYRALVRARWDEAVRRGTPALVVQAGAMSKPILERLGFETVCEMRTFVDHVSNR